MKRFTLIALCASLLFASCIDETNTIEDPVKDPVENPGQKPGEDPGEEPGEQPGENPGSDVVVYPTKLIVTMVEGLDPKTGIIAGNEFHLKVTYEPENTTYKKVDWEISPKTYAEYTVIAEDEILVRPLKPGQAKVKVSNNPGREAYWPGEGEFFTINYAPAESVSFEAAEITVGYYTAKNDAEKNLGKLYAKVLPEGRAKQDLEWWSDNPEICRVVYGGKDYCDYETKGVGTTTIHAKSASYPNVQGACVVHVTDERVYVQSIKLSSTTMQRAPGSQFNLTATVYPENASVYDFDWVFEEGSLMVYSASTYNPPSIIAAPLKLGSYTIKIVDKLTGVSAECQLDAVYKNPAGKYRWVDLGLSVYWAEYNYYEGQILGNGHWTYLAFGEFEKKNNYTSSTYLYRTAAQLWDLIGKDGCLKPKYDVMTQKSGESQWRLPSSEEWQELIDGCTWKQITVDSTTGVQGTSKKNGNTIFLPYSGRMDGTNAQYESHNGYYWTRTICDDALPMMLHLQEHNTSMSLEKSNNYLGHTVRGVLPKEYKPEE